MDTLNAISKTESLKDRYGRQFQDLRISLTNKCNLACVYCVDEEESIAEGTPYLPERNTGILYPREFSSIVKRLNTFLNLKTVRLTGGEPLLYRPLPRLVEFLKNDGIPEVSLTTNASLLKARMPELSRAGVDRMNISLDAMDPQVHHKISRRDNFKAVMAGIDAALDAGVPVKINCTVYEGINPAEILPLLEFAGKRNLSIRFLELMNMGHLHKDFSSYVFTEADILQEISKAHSYEPEERELSATSRYWKTSEGFRFGIIANHSTPFCRDCNRLRLDSLGNIYGCISEKNGISVRHWLDEEESEVQDVLQKAMNQKQVDSFTGSPLTMKFLGG